VIARPRIKATFVVSQVWDAYIGVLTVDVTLAFICLRDKQVRHMPADAVFVRHCIATEDFLKPFHRSVKASKLVCCTYVRALTKARSQFCLLIMEIISGAALPSSLSLPTW